MPLVGTTDVGGIVEPRTLEFRVKMIEMLTACSCVRKQLWQPIHNLNTIT